MKLLKIFLIAGILWVGAFGTTVVNAGGDLTFDLIRNGDLINVDDAAGRWQHSGGEFYCPDFGPQAGYWAMQKRVTFTGTSPQNTAMMTLTLFFLTDDPSAPPTITVQGSHSFNDGSFEGGVSANSFGKALDGRSAWGEAGDYVTIKGGENIFDICE